LADPPDSRDLRAVRSSPERSPVVAAGIPPGRLIAEKPAFLAFWAHCALHDYYCLTSPVVDLTVAPADVHLSLRRHPPQEQPVPGSLVLQHHQRRRVQQPGLERRRRHARARRLRAVNLQGR